MYREPMEKFEEEIKKAFPKSARALFTSSRARKVTGSHPHQIKKWLEEMVQEGRLRKATAYFFGCPPDMLIIEDFGFGEAAICPVCNSEVAWPPEDSERSIMCENCEVVYVKLRDDRWHTTSGPYNWGALLGKADSHAYDFLFWYEQ